MKQITTPADIKHLGTILSIWAHPDDESFLAAGIMATAVEQGQAVICVTATRGEAGNQNPTKWPSKDLAKIRTAELNKALTVLGVSHHFWLNYADGCCCDVTESQAVEQLVAIATRFKPDSILTFGPDGWTGHEDHKTMFNWARALVKKLDKNIPIYSVTHTPEHYKKYFKPADEELNMFFNIDKPNLNSARQCDIYYELPDSARQKKKAALAASPSQTETLFKVFSQNFLDEAFAVECFELQKP